MTDQTNIELLNLYKLLGSAVEVLGDAIEIANYPLPNFAKNTAVCSLHNSLGRVQNIINKIAVMIKENY
ncbi:TPA: hypothetical protein ACPSKY_002569 [Legionella bozemanae]